MCSTKKGVKMAGRFLHVFITSYILTGTIAQQQFVLVASNTSSTSKQFVLVAPTTTSLIGISTLMTPASSPPAMAIMSTTRKSSNRYVCIKTWNHICPSRCPSKTIFTFIYYIKLKSRLSVCPFICIFGMLITQQPLHGLKQDLLEMKGVSLRITEFIFTSLQGPLFIDRSA